MVSHLFVLPFTLIMCTNYLYRPVVPSPPFLWRDRRALLSCLIVLLICTTMWSVVRLSLQGPMSLALLLLTSAVPYCSFLRSLFLPFCTAHLHCSTVLCTAHLHCSTLLCTALTCPDSEITGRRGFEGTGCATSPAWAICRVTMLWQHVLGFVGRDHVDPPGLRGHCSDNAGATCAAIT